MNAAFDPTRVIDEKSPLIVSPHASQIDIRDALTARHAQISALLSMLSVGYSARDEKTIHVTDPVMHNAVWAASALLEQAELLTSAIKVCPNKMGDVYTQQS